MKNVIAQVSGGSKQIIDNDNFKTIADLKTHLNVPEYEAKNEFGEVLEDSYEVESGDYVSFTAKVKGA